MSVYDRLLVEKENFEEYAERLDQFFSVADDADDLHNAKQIRIMVQKRLDSINSCLNYMGDPDYESG